MSLPYTIESASRVLLPVGTGKVHVGFDDPSRLAASSATAQEAMSHTRRVRDEINALAEKLPQVLDE